ncbi:MAG: alkaline phosphatase family protein [Chromatiaceae bacterium]
MNLPDYHGGSIVNLMSSIVSARGGRSQYAPLRLLPPAELAHVTNIALLVVDGLGADYLRRVSPGGLLARHQMGAITSVFPPTTAAAITSFLTGDAPQQHGVPGWFTYFRELGCVMTVLPGEPRYGGVSYRKAEIDAAKLFGHRVLFDRVEGRAIVVSPSHIARSDFNLAHLGRAQLLTFKTLPQMFRRTLHAIRARQGRKLLYLYWPKLDAIGHEKGIESESAHAHVRKIERALADFLVGAAGTDTVLLVTADHGQIDTRGSDRIDLADHPILAQALVLPLCGEPRAAFCYVRPDSVGEFEHYCRDVLSDRLDLWRSSDLVERGLFGIGAPHPRLHERIGDYCLLMRDNYVVRDSLPFEKHHSQIGVHGGLSDAELKVPLCLFRT